MKFYNVLFDDFILYCIVLYTTIIYKLPASGFYWYL